MSDYEADSVDQPLREWAKQRTASAERLGTLVARISSAIDEQLQKEADRSPAATPSRPHVARVFAFFAGAAAVLLVMLLTDRGTREEPATGEPVLHLARLDADQLQHKRLLLREMDQVFDQRLTWIVESQDHLRFALDEHQPAIDGTQPLAVRLVVVRRGSRSEQWEQVWQADVISRSEQLVHLPDPADAGARLTIWAYVLPDGNVGVDTHLAFDHLGLQPAATTEIQQQGVPAQLSSQELNGAEYQIYQTVALLDENAE